MARTTRNKNQKIIIIVIVIILSIWIFKTGEFTLFGTYVPGVIECDANTYYVDATNGDDSWDGACSELDGGSGPWKTTNKVNTDPAITSGVTVKFKTGETFRGYEVVDPVATLIPKTGVTYTSYHNPANPKPIISAAIDATDSSRYQWSSTATANEYMLEAVGGGSPNIIQTDGVWMNGEYLINRLYANTPGSLSNHEWSWSGNTVYLRTDEGNPSTMGLIEIAQKTSAVWVSYEDNIIIDDLHIKHSNIFTPSWDYRGTLTLRDTTNVVVQNSIIEESSQYSVIFIRRMTNSLITNNIIRNMRRENYYNDDLRRNIITMPSSSFNTISNNEIYNNPFGSDLLFITEGSSDNIVEYNEFIGPSANAVYIRGVSNPSTNNHIRYNYIHDIYSETYYGGGIGIQVRDEVIDNKIYGNVLMQLRGPIIQSDGINGGGIVQGTKIFNNIIYNTWNPSSGVIKVFGGQNEGTEVKNNIVMSVGIGLMLGTHNGAVIDNNCVYPLGSEPAIGDTNSGEITNTITDDPLIVDSSPTSPSGLALRSGSPCIDSGLNLGSTYELGLNPSSYWTNGVGLLNHNLYGTGWEIGPFVYTSSAPCVPETCNGLGYECDIWDDTCGSTVDCGNCDTGHSCNGGICEAICVPETCPSLGFNCGSAFDQCSETIFCGICDSGEECVANVCITTCVPETCSSLSFDCNTADDTCGGTLSCGTCNSGFECQNNICTEIPIVCTPETCSSLGFNCGSADDNCEGTLSCGTCPSGDDCTNNICTTPSGGGGGGGSNPSRDCTDGGGQFNFTSYICMCPETNFWNETSDLCVEEQIPEEEPPATSPFVWIVIIGIIIFIVNKKKKKR